MRRLDLTGIQIDQSGKDVVRLCFMSFDPALYHNLHATEIEPSPEPEQSQRLSNGVVNLSERQRIATDLLRVIDWQSETSGYLVCPGKHLHTTDDGERDCRIDLDDIPTVHCFHNSCRGILAGINHELRSRIAKTELTGIKQHGQKATANQTARDDARSDLTSLSSLGAAEYPAELEESAFYGLAGEIVREVRNHFPKETFQTIINRNVRLSEAPSFGQAILDYDPSSPGALAYRTLAEEVIARG